jgi:hypothetical protein
MTRQTLRNEDTVRMSVLQSNPTKSATLGLDKSCNSHMSLPYVDRIFSGFMILLRRPISQIVASNSELSSNEL